MGVHVVFAVFVAAAVGFELTDEEYHEMPPLFRLDDWDACMAKSHTAFCLGSFDLLSSGNDQLFNNIKKISANKFNFNHTKIHRGYCLPTSCSHIQEPSMKTRFERCVDNITRSQYGLSATLSKFEYCRTKTNELAVDQWDMLFVCLVGVILIMNLFGTAYDLMGKIDGKGNTCLYLSAWSLRANWNRLTADYSDRDPRLTALKPIHGVKVLTLILVMFGHTPLIYHYTYLHNPQFLEKSSRNLFSSFFLNGSSLVQTFVMVSCFLLAYNLLIHADDKPDKPLSITMFPKCLLHRIARLAPLYVFVLSAAATWWARASDGPLWRPLVAAEAARCRTAWTKQVLFVHNIAQPQTRCLIHTWFVAVDMQLYIVTTIITLVLGRWPRAAIKVLYGLITLAIAGNYAMIYNWNLKPMLQLMYPDLMRYQFVGQDSFEWLYTAPWDSLPSALIGLLAAFLYHMQQKEGYKPAEHWWIRVLYRLSVPCMASWILSGHWMKDVTNPILVSLYATLDRPVFVTFSCIAMYGFLNKIDTIWWQLMSWRGWEILSRMALSIYLTHWMFMLTILGVKTTTSLANTYEMGGLWLDTVFLSYCSAVPLHLLIEAPLQRFLQALFQSKA